uniref:Zinc finger protein 654 n=1 Tax=Leptobrachium leishanense TaxID=445787 RepID=A0A8C5P6P4_9ANUR
MAEDESDQESERLVEELEAIVQEELQAVAADEVRSREYCRRFCQVAEEYTARWQVPLPQVQVLQTALCCFTSASVSLPAQCEHVQYVLSRLALSLFELLLFFGKDEFYEDPLKDILGSVQECHDLLFQYDNTDLMLVTGIIKDGGPWEHPVLQAMLKGKSEPEDIVDKYMKSENPLFFELRVRYLIACERIPEAMALITTCLSHPEVSKNLYYHQAYFTCLYMARLTDKLLQEHVCRIDCTDGVQIICNTESEGKTGLAWQLSESFLLTQLRSGEMYCIWDLIFVWSKLQLKINPSKQAFVEQCYQMLRIATNVKVIFPFMKIITQEIAEAGIQLSVELCGCALQLDLHNDQETKCLIYKTIASLLPNDLEICRVCALSVFFLERTPESYSDVERLYKCSDEDYNEFASFVENRVRFELLPILKRGLLFDPEFWNLSTLQQNCAILLGDEADATSLNFNKTDVVVQSSNDEDCSAKDLNNGLVEHIKPSGINPKNHTVVAAYKTDHNVPRHKCMLCNKEFLGGHIFRHARSHQKKGCFSCVLCARKFRNKVTLLRHLDNHVRKIQRQPIAKRDNDGSVAVETDEAPSSDTLLLCLENGNCSSSTSEVSTSVSDSTPQHPVPETGTPVENHTTDLNHVTVLTKTEVENQLPSTPPECTKINGSLHTSGDDCVVTQGEKYRCPALGCVRVFKMPSSLNKHARKAHPTDPAVQQHLMKWSKGKCRFCLQRFAAAQHYIDHMNRHIYPNAYFCHHLDCDKSFKLASQLAEHMSTHDTFRAQCSFAECYDIFGKLSNLYAHEALHYKINCDLRTDGDTRLPEESPPEFDVESDIQGSKDATNGQTLVSGGNVEPVKDKEVVDLLVPVWKSRMDIAKPKTYTQIEKKSNDNVQNGEEDLQTIPSHSETLGTHPLVEEPYPENVAENIPNGYNESDQIVGCVTPTDAAQTITDTGGSFVPDTSPETPQKASAAPQQAETLSKMYHGASRVYIRPLPSSYLDEQFLSMPKRRKKEDEKKTENDADAKKPVERFRCEKCLTNYCSSEALNDHLAQKKCHSLFGFDSDDESAW